MLEMLEPLLPFIIVLAKILAVVLPLLIVVAYVTYFERKVIGYIQVRYGANRVGPYGLLQPFADLIKNMFKEVILPSRSNRFLFLLAPVFALAPGLATWAVIPFMPGLVISDLNAGVLLVFALSSLSVYGILIAGWASNSKYAFFGALRSAAQAVSYEIAMGFSFVGVLLAAGSMNLSTIVAHQQGGIFHWYFLPLFPLFVIFWISGVAETNRAPFDLAEGESEIVAGFHVEYSSTAFLVFFLAEYAAMVLFSILISVLFLGGWLSPFEGIPVLGRLFDWVPGIIWLFAKTSFFIFVYFWLRATFPRYRYDQLMRLGWKVLIPVTIVWVVVVALMVELRLPPWFSA